jgi:hypothetical protein
VPHIDRLRVRAPPSGVRSNLRKWCWRKLWSHFAMYSVAPMGEGAVLVCYPLLIILERVACVDVWIYD